MTKVLVTGISCTGKSTVLIEPSKRGHRVVDTDYGRWCEDAAFGQAVNADPQPATAKREYALRNYANSAVRCGDDACGQPLSNPERFT